MGRGGGRDRVGGGVCHMEVGCTMWSVSCVGGACRVEVEYTMWNWIVPRGGGVCYVEMEVEYAMWRWRWSVSRGDRGEGGVKKLHRPPPTVCCFVEGTGGSIDLMGNLAFDILG